MEAEEWRERVEKAVPELEGAFSRMVEAVLPSLEERVVEIMNENGLEASTPQEVTIVALTALGMGPSEVGRIAGCSRATVWRRMEDENYAAAVEALRELMMRRIFRWTMGLLPLAAFALMENLVEGDLDQKRMAARVVLGLLGGGSKVSGLGGSRAPAPRVEAGTWKLVKGSW